ncbi:uncharacterized protein LOC128261630 [Drosophila gunungcola]|uniref:Uncharacterized protein n=1 Tax=Drosophila gunungcola TaxID=103775 RepID=A0A9Q0BSE1_9MUSC|nr:uncharacterized protein LOC128261630 [Drosophila gunungcola]KAI8042877.1 hypothetical protein M5D96_004200 [Drosophila gunungcola]
MRELEILRICLIIGSLLLCNCFANAKPYVNDFVFPSEDEQNKREYPLWEPIKVDQGTESSDYNGQRGVWVTSDIKSMDKCRDFQLDESSGHVRLIFISYKKVCDPLESLNRALTEELNLPELVFSVKVVKSGKSRLVFELPNAVDAFLTLNNYCKLCHDRHNLTYEILNVEGSK